MNQDSSLPPMLPPSTELGALLFAVLPCLQETYRPLASFAYHMTELSRIKTIPSLPSLSGLSGIDALITDKDGMLRSLTFYGKLFRMPLLSTIATLLQGMQFYRVYKDILPGLFSGMGSSDSDPASAFGSMASLFSGLGGFGGSNASGTPGGNASDLFSMLGGLAPDLLASLFSGFSGGSTSQSEASAEKTSKKTTGNSTVAEDSNIDTDLSDTSYPPPETVNVTDIPNVTAPFPEASPSTEAAPEPSSDSLFDSLYSFLTPEQQKIYEQLMHTD